MNIIDVLHELGYDVLAFNEEGHYKVKFGTKRLAAIRKLLKNGGGFDGDPTDTWEIYVDEVGFNGLGDLYVSFKEVGTEHENSCFDGYEYRNEIEIEY